MDMVMVDMDMEEDTEGVIEGGMDMVVVDTDEVDMDIMVCIVSIINCLPPTYNLSSESFN